MPSFFSSLPTENPGVPFSTMNAAIPLRFCAGSVCPKTIARLESDPFVMKFFVPFRIHVSPSRRADVRIAAASLPDAGSDRAKQPIHSRWSPLDELDREGDRLATTEAERRDAAGLGACAQGIQERDQKARAGRADGMAEGHGAAVHVELRFGYVQLAANAFDAAERLVHL